MSLAPLEIICDAPPYAIVQACSGIGLQKPEDVRWWEITHFLAARGYGQAGAASLGTVDLRTQPRAKAFACLCGTDLPRMVEYRFFFDDGTHADYFLGQCEHCRTVYWRGPAEVERTEAWRS